MIESRFCTEINVKAREAYNNSYVKGFHDGDPKPGEGYTIGRLAQFVANLHGEASELWESARKKTLFSRCDKEGCSLTCSEEELADIVIRVFDTAYSLGINIGSAIESKMAYNSTRPHKHGGKLA
jgi:hypothetical protein